MKTVVYDHPDEKNCAKVGSRKFQSSSTSNKGVYNLLLSMHYAYNRRYRSNGEYDELREHQQ